MTKGSWKRLMSAVGSEEESFEIKVVVFGDFFEEQEVR